MAKYTLKRIDIEPNVIIGDNFTCVEHCKETARRVRRKDFYTYHRMQFEISFNGTVYARSILDTGWRMAWDKIGGVLCGEQETFSKQGALVAGE